MGSLLSGQYQRVDPKKRLRSTVEWGDGEEPPSGLHSCEARWYDIKRVLPDEWIGPLQNFLVEQKGYRPPIIETDRIVDYHVFDFLEQANREWIEPVKNKSL